MKAKLIKTDKGNYILIDPTKGVYDKGWQLGNSIECDVPKLSKQNCEEIFGVVDVKKMGWEYYQNNGLYFHSDIAFASGLNKAMELYKFTLEDMISFGRWIISNQEFENTSSWSKDTAIYHLNKWKSLQQPTEIEVEIVMETISEGLDEMAQPQYGKVPKLDSEGKLILKRVI